MTITHVRRVYAKVPGAKRGVAVYDFLLGGHAQQLAHNRPLGCTPEFAEITARYPAGTLFKMPEIRVR